MDTPKGYMVRIPPKPNEKFHLIGEIGDADPNSEPSRAFWTNASVKALMAETPQHEYISACKRVRGDWRSIETSGRPFGQPDQLCQSCADVYPEWFAAATGGVV